MHIFNILAAQQNEAKQNRKYDCNKFALIQLHKHCMYKKWKLIALPVGYTMRDFATTGRKIQRNRWILFVHVPCKHY